ERAGNPWASRFELKRSYSGVGPSSHPSREGGSTMFEQLFKGPHALTCQRKGPLAEERLRYLVHCAEQQMCPGTLRRIAIYTLVVAKALRLADRPGELVTRPAIEAQADRWANRHPRPPAM